MNMMQLAVLAGVVSTTLFATSHIPMLVRAYRTKDLRSYSVANLALVNCGNAFHWLYVASLPPGPIWALHSLYTVTAALMLWWSLRYRRGAAGRSDPQALSTPQWRIGQRDYPRGAWRRATNNNNLKEQSHV